MDIVIIGSGNVATALGRKILASGHGVLQLVARNQSTGQQLATELQAEYTDSMDEVRKDASIYIVAISDDALRNLPLRLDKLLVVHTAGSTPANALERVSKNYGVLYPLQTFRAEASQVPAFPMLVDGNSPETLTMLMDFAESFSTTVKHADDAYRIRIHLAAVAAGNFSNHLYALVQEYCKKERVDFDLLMPLLSEVLSNSSEAYNRQTGPALRKDIGTIQSHLAMLEKYPDLTDLYQMFTASIDRYHHSQKRL